MPVSQKPMPKPTIDHSTVILQGEYFPPRLFHGKFSCFFCRVLPIYTCIFGWLGLHRAL